MSHLLSLSTIATNRFTVVVSSSAAAAANTVLSIGSPFPKSSSAYRLAFQSKAMTEGSSSKSQTTVIKPQVEEKPPEKLPPPPEKPLPGDCCGNGCEPCVWDIYYEELADYNKLLDESKTKNTTSSVPAKSDPLP